MNRARVVYDCNVYLQALASIDGPAGRCVSLALNQSVELFTSATVLAELREVALRPKLSRQFQITADRLDRFIESLEIASTFLIDVPKIFRYARDPSDAHYIDVAIAAHASLVVSRDRDLLDLMTSSDDSSQDLRRRYPELRVVDPVRFLDEMRT